MKRINSVVLPSLLLILVLALTPVQAELERTSAAGIELLIDWRGDFSKEQRDRLTDWMITVVDTVSLLNGELPRSQMRIAFQPYASKSAVPFARVLRNDPQGVLFYVNPDRPLDEFVSDWTAYHELSHLFIPYPGNADIWFSEGLASYYQNILQFRAGLLTRDEAVQKLLSGFERGEADDSHADLTLAELSPIMRDRHAYMRVYWSGALFFLEADIQLRRQTLARAIPLTVDDVLREFGSCCLEQQRNWTGAEIVAEFDRIAETNLFSPLYEAYEASLKIPAYRLLLVSPEMDEILPPRPRSDNLYVQ